MPTTRASKTKKRAPRAKPSRRTAGNKAATADVQFRVAAVIRGDAVPADASGRLPPGATHEITGQDKFGMPTIKRKRFSIG